MDDENDDDREREERAAAEMRAESEDRAETEDRERLEPPVPEVAEEPAVYTPEEYERLFNRLVRKRLPRFGLELD